VYILYLYFVYMFVRRISVVDARANFSSLLGGVHYSKEAVMVERNGKPFAVVVSPEEYQQIQERQERAWKSVERLQELNADKDPEEVLADVTAEVEAVRQERYEQQQRKAAKKSRR
jgi:prevent-host-death family protein